MYKTLSLFLFFSLFIQAQTKYDLFYSYLDKADSLKHIKIYDKALVNYKEAVKYVTPKKASAFGGRTGINVYFNLGVCALYTGDEILADKWMRKAISIGGLKKIYLEVFDGYPDIQEKIFYKQIISDYNKLRLDFFASLKDIDAYLEIQILTERDQFVRKIDNYLDGYDDEYIARIHKKYIQAIKNKDSIQIKKFTALRNKLRVRPWERNLKYMEFKRELMKNVDSLNARNLIRFTTNYGWYCEASLLLWHWRVEFGTDHYVWNYFMPILLKEIEDENISSGFIENLESFKKKEKEFRKNIKKIKK